MTEQVDEGFFGIGIYRPKREYNIGTLWRTALILGASYIFTIDKKYKKQSSDVLKSWRKIPLFQFPDFDAFYGSLPYYAQLVGIELGEEAEAIQSFKHPRRAVYLLGAEDTGLPDEIIERCHHLIQLPGEHSLNVAVAGSIVLFDRVNKGDSLNLDNTVARPRKGRS